MRSGAAEDHPRNPTQREGRQVQPSPPSDYHPTSPGSNKAPPGPPPGRIRDGGAAGFGHLRPGIHQPKPAAHWHPGPALAPIGEVPHRDAPSSPLDPEPIPVFVCACWTAGARLRLGMQLKPHGTTGRQMAVMAGTSPAIPLVTRRSAGATALLVVSWLNTWPISVSGIVHYLACSSRYSSSSSYWSTHPHAMIEIRPSSMSI